VLKAVPTAQNIVDTDAHSRHIFVHRVRAIATIAVLIAIREDALLGVRIVKKIAHNPWRSR
jgi:hypothetical protein